MSERSPNYGAFSQFDEAQDTTTIPPISSFAKRNTRLSTSADSEERSQSTGYYRELTLEGMSPNGSASNTSQTPTSPIAMQPQSSQPQQQQQHQGQQRPGSEQQYAKAVAAAVAAAYQAQAQAQEMSGIADGGMVPVPVPAAAGSSGTSISSVPGLPVQPATSGAVSVNMASPPPLLPMQVANSSLLGQALQAANDMGGLSALQLAVQQQQLQQQQQFLHAVQAAHAQNAGHKMMSPTPSNEQALTLNNQGASPPGDTDSRDEEKTALVNLMPPSSLASPVSIQQGDQADLHAMVPSSQMQTPISSQLLTSSTSSDNAYTMPATATAAPLPSINMPAGMMAGTNHVSNLNMGLAPHLIQLNNPQASMPVPQMVIQPGGPAGQEMVSPEQMMVQGVANITNNNNIDMMSNMPTQCTSSSTKRRNSKRPVPDTEKDEKYFERRSRNNMAAKRSRDSRKRREDQVSMRANFLQKENDILRAQLATLRQEANSLKQLLTQQRPIMPAQMSMQMPTQVMPKNMPE